MEQIVIPGVPAEYAALIYIVIGGLSAWLVAPVTAIIKKLGGTKGVTTVSVSAFLSLFVSLGFALITADVQDKGVNWLGVLISALVAFLRANGEYLTRVNATAKGVQQPAPATVGEILPPPEVMGGGER